MAAPGGAVIEIVAGDGNCSYAAGELGRMGFTRSWHAATRFAADELDDARRYFENMVEQDPDVQIVIHEHV